MTLCIIGLGLIGGSFAKDLRAAGLASELLGTDASAEHARRALELGFVDRRAHPDDGRQVLVSVSATGAELIEVERRASREWLQQRLAELTPEERKTLVMAAELMTVIVDESASA